ncbi:MAG TPA: hypothetical protein PLI18_14085 [Pirellulaceae bacterium]|nr:hypothetical protein [Pirellulaceae bacterium]
MPTETSTDLAMSTATAMSTELATSNRMRGIASQRPFRRRDAFHAAQSASGVASIER